MNLDHEQLESLLLRYSPVGPSQELRDRVLNTTAPQPLSFGMKLWWGSAAAMVLLTIGLHWSAARIEAQTHVLLTGPPMPLTPEAEAAVALLGGDEAAKKYVAMRIEADRRESLAMFQRQSSQGINP